MSDRPPPPIDPPPPPGPDEPGWSGPPPSWAPPGAPPPATGEQPPGWQQQPPGWQAPPGWGQPEAGWERPGPPRTPWGQALAPWWKRAVAIIVDTLVFGIPITIVLVALGAADEPGGNLVSFVASLLYFGLLNGSERGQTVGKMALSIQVRDVNGPAPIGSGRGLLREVVQQVLFLACIIPGIINVLSPLWDPRRQTWHDKAANSVVVEVG